MKQTYKAHLRKDYFNALAKDRTLVLATVIEVTDCHVIIRCPLCSRTHLHGKGNKPDNAEYFGTREPHCVYFKPKGIEYGLLNLSDNNKDPFTAYEQQELLQKVHEYKEEEEWKNDREEFRKMMKEGN